MTTPKTTAKKKKAKKATNRVAKHLGNSNGNGNSKTKTTPKNLVIQPPNFQTAEFHLRGTTVLVQHKWSEKARKEMRDKQAAGSTAKKNRKREPKDFQAAREGATHYTDDKGYGIPSGAFFKAMVSACRLCDFKMTAARQALYVIPNAKSADPAYRGGLVRITKGEPVHFEAMVRIQQTTDIRARPLWEPGWECLLQVRFDADVFTLQDVANLLMRAGMQVGVGEGRPDTPSGGMGWGLFELLAD